MIKITTAEYDLLKQDLATYLERYSLGLVLGALAEAVASKEIAGTPEGDIMIDTAIKLIKMANSKKVTSIS